MSTENNPTQFRGDVAATIAAYRKITDKRGHGVFDPPELSGTEKMERRNNLQNGTTAEESKAIIDLANDEHKAKSEKFLAAAYNYNHPAHLEAKRDFAQQFNSDPEKARAYFKDETYRSFGIGAAHIRNTAYEQKLVTPPNLTTDADAYRHKALVDLLKAKWPAVGYAGDKQLIQDFDALYPGAVDYSQYADKAEGLPMQFIPEYL